MPTAQNSLNINSVAALAKQAAPDVLSAIKQASARTGVDFAYLVKQAATESSFKPEIQSKTSSATGLYQFIEGTWLSMVEKHGAKYGLGDFAEKIKNGTHKQNPRLKQEILDLRKDPQKAALLAAEFAAENRRYMAGQGIEDIGATELYLAHFMGAGGATAFLKAQRDNPLQNAADLFPKAAQVNRNVFYDPQTGRSRTLAGVYDLFAKKFDDQSQEPPQTPPSPLRTAAVKRPSVPASIFSSFVPAPDNHTQAAFRLLSVPERTKTSAAFLPFRPLLADPIALMMLAQTELFPQNEQKR
ncbi:MAG: lytic transglycosylase domain-containing protein [Alphaproteobacteria bacterium]|nr:lytic transglycosylase domain-containing protein [Alphaproteobacteria bacterium]